MKKAFSSFRQGALLLFVLFLLLLLLTNTALAMDGVRRGLSLCVETLFPSLFPFLVLSELFVVTGAGESLGRLFSRPVSALFGVSGAGATVLLLGAVCGSPTGAVAAASLCERGEIDKPEFDRLLLFCNNPSSGFLVGAVGEALFGNHTAGMVLFGITLLSAATVGIFLRVVLGRVNVTEKKPVNGARNPLSPSDFIYSIKHAFSALLQVCAFVLFFSCVSLCATRFLGNLSLPPMLGVALTGLLEMTSGISAAVTALSPASAFCITAFFARFSGLSVCLQIFSVAERQKPRLGPFLLARLAQGSLAFLLALAYVLLCNPTFSPSQSIGAFARGVRPHSLALVLLSVLLLLGTLAAYRKGKATLKTSKKG